MVDRVIYHAAGFKNVKVLETGMDLCGTNNRDARSDSSISVHVDASGISSIMTVCFAGDKTSGSSG